MKLSEINTTLPCPNDANFERLGVITTNNNSKPFLTFLYNDKFIEKAIKNNLVTAIITTLEVSKLLLKEKPSLGILISNSPRDDFYNLHKRLYDSGFYKINAITPRISSTAILHSSVNLLGDNISIGDNTVIAPNVTIYNNVSIGDNCTIQAGAVIGSKAIVSYNNTNKSNILVQPAGGVTIGNDVIIGTNSTIDNGLFNDTIIKNNVLIDNLVMIAHDVIIHENCRIIAGAIISGYTIIEQENQIGPNATISDGIVVEKNSRISIGAVVIKSVKSNQVISGNFGMDHMTLLKTMAYNKKNISQF